jgi:hypothetical protein
LLANIVPICVRTVLKLTGPTAHCEQLYLPYALILLPHPSIVHTPFSIAASTTSGEHWRTLEQV